jgi:hypothetical protein
VARSLVLWHCTSLSFDFVSRNVLILCSSWAVGGGVGPVIGGSLAQSGNWYAPLGNQPPSILLNSLFSIFQEMVVLYVKLSLAV